jgi:hypothetical protein
MDVREMIAEMFWEDYQAEWDGEAENWSQLVILSDFLVWLSKRKTGGQLIDMRLAKEPFAQSTVDELMEIRDLAEKEA